ncbi:hypothetical protein VTK56DRAFT_8983 [Thermocarpiscus australiensis]
METSSQYFGDCLTFDDPSSYQSSGQDAESGNLNLHVFSPYGGKLDDNGGSSTPAEDGDLEPRADVWDGFAEQMGNVAASDQKQLFVDPGLYSPESENEDMQEQINVLSMDTSRPSTRRTSGSGTFSQRTSKSSTAFTDITPPEQDPPRKRKVRKVKKESNTAEEEQKRSRFLERNRIAASKCREKKKQYVSELEGKKMGLEEKYQQLHLEYNGLLNEVSGLKHHLMAHAKCNDPNIDRWLSNEARRYVQTTQELFSNPFASLGPSGSQSTFATTPPRSRNPSIASSYPSLQNLQFEGLGSGERHGSIAYSQGTAPLYSPSEETFPCLKREPGINYDHMPDSMFSSDQPTFAAG